MNIAIIDDEKMWRDKARKLIERHYKKIEMQIDEFESGEHFLIEKKKYDLIFMDIEMPGLDGLDTLQEYRLFTAEGIAVILTTHMEIVQKGYFVDAFRYVNKGKMEEELEEALTSADIRMKTNEILTFHQVGFGEVSLRIRDILYIETEKRNIIVHTDNEDYICSGTIAEYEKILEPISFFRSHKSYIVNLDKIKRMDGTSVYFANGKSAYVSERKYVETKRQYMKRKRIITNR